MGHPDTRHFQAIASIETSSSTSWCHHTMTHNTHQVRRLDNCRQYTKFKIDITTLLLPVGNSDCRSFSSVIMLMLKCDTPHPLWHTPALGLQELGPAQIGVTMFHEKNGWQEEKQNEYSQRKERHEKGKEKKEASDEEKERDL